MNEAPVIDQKAQLKIMLKQLIPGLIAFGTASVLLHFFGSK